MADTNNLTNFLGDVADAIRAKTGSSELIPAANFDTEIANIPTGGGIPDGIFIQEEIPTKTTTEAFWLEEQDMSDVKPLDNLSQGVLDIGGGTLVESLPQASIDTINSKTYIMFADESYDGSRPMILISDTEFTGFGTTVLHGTNLYYYSHNTPNGAHLYNDAIGMSVIGDTNNYGVRYFDQNNAFGATEPGIHIDVDGTRYIVKQSKSTAQGFTTILDSTSTNATANDIAFGKTAIVNNTKLVGTINNQGDVTILPSTNAQTMNAGYYNSINISAVNNSIDANITPSNIANGVNILGVIGTLSGGEDLNNVLNNQEALIANLQNQVNILNAALDNAAGGGGSVDYNSRYSDEMNTLNVFSSYIANDTFDYMYHNFDTYDSSVTYPENIIPWHAFRYYNNVPLNNIFDASVANGVYFLINYDVVGYNIDSFWVEINTANGCFDIYLSATDPEISRNIANGTIFANLDFENQYTMEFQYIPIPNTNNIRWCLKGYDSNIGEDTYQELNYEGFCDMCKIINRYEDAIIADNAWSSTSVSLAYNTQSMNTKNWIEIFNNPNLDINMIPIVSNEISKMLTIGLVNIS